MLNSSQSLTKQSSIGTAAIKLVIGLSLLFVPYAITASAQNDGPPRLKSDGLQADAAILRRAYEALHPGLYRYNSKLQMDAAFAALNRSFDHDQRLQDAFLAFSEFAAKVRCGHTQANPFNQSKAVMEGLLQTSTRVPFYFQWLDRRMIVIKDFTPDRSVPQGTEIIQINGVSVQLILAKLMTIARADGTNDSKRIAELAVTGDSRYETFDLYYPMFFPQRSAQTDLVVQGPGSNRKRYLRVKPFTYEQRIAPIQQREEQREHGNDVLFEWSYPAGSSAYLKMPTWALYNSKWDWKQWLNDKMNEAADKSAPAIVVDLRGNEGGEDVGNIILTHLIDSPIALSPMRRLVRYRKIPEDLSRYLDTWDKGFLDWGSSAIDLHNPWPTAPSVVPYLRLIRYDDDASGDIVKPAGRRFRGKLIVLIDASNSSATFQFAQNIQLHHLGTLVGQPTGGSQRGINGGAFFFLRLPNSGIEMDLPLIGTFSPTAMPDTGVMPDVFIKRTAIDVVTGRDPELAAALAAAKMN